MSEPTELAPNIWLFQGEADSANYGAVLARETALLVYAAANAPDETGTPPINEFLDSRGVDRWAVITLGEYSGEELDTSHWSYMHMDNDMSGKMSGYPWPQKETVDTDGNFELPIPGWQFLSLYGPYAPSVHNATDGILFSGYVLAGEHAPELCKGGQEYLRELEHIEKLDPKLVVPSHGQPTQGKREVRARVERDKQYVYAVQRHVQTAKAAGHNLDRTLQAARTAYEDYPFVETHVRNVQRVWEEEQVAC